MLDVVPLRYGTAFKKAFSDPLTFHALVKAAIGIDFHPTRVQQEFSYPQTVARVKVAYDLFAEDEHHRTIVELQHIRDDETYDRFLYYHCIGLAEQVVSSERYTLERDVYTLVLLTRWPQEERLRYGRAICELDPVTDEGKKLGVYRHRLVFVNVKAPADRLPVALRPLLALMEDTLDGKVDEGKYPDEISKRILGQIQRAHLSPEENAKLKDEATWEAAQREENRRGEELGFQKGKKLGMDEGKKLGMDEGQQVGWKQGLHEAVLDLCQAYAVELTEEKRAFLHTLDVPGLLRLRAELKAAKAWPLR